MPELDVIGRAEKPEELDLQPIIVPVCAYRTGEKPEEVVERFPFKPVMPTGARVLLESNVGEGGQTPFQLVPVILVRCLMPDATERWHEFLDNDELNVSQETLGEVLTALYEHYAGRPTRRRSGSPTTGSRRGRTSPGGQLSTEQT